MKSLAIAAIAVIVVFAFSASAHAGPIARTAQASRGAVSKALGVPRAVRQRIADRPRQLRRVAGRLFSIRVLPRNRR